MKGWRDHTMYGIILIFGAGFGAAWFLYEEIILPEKIKSTSVHINSKLNQLESERDQLKVSLSVSEKLILTKYEKKIVELKNRIIFLNSDTNKNQVTRLKRSIIDKEKVPSSNSKISTKSYNKGLSTYVYGLTENYKNRKSVTLIPSASIMEFIDTDYRDSFESEVIRTKPSLVDFYKKPYGILWKGYINIEKTANHIFLLTAEHSEVCCTNGGPYKAFYISLSISGKKIAFVEKLNYGSGLQPGETKKSELVTILLEKGLQPISVWIANYNIDYKYKPSGLLAQVKIKFPGGSSLIALPVNKLFHRAP